MDFPRFVAMLEYGGLFFSAVNKMEDVLEGSLSKPSSQNLQRLRAALTESGIETDLSGVDLLRALRRCISISSWHFNEHESAAMWKLYAASEQAIAIRTTHRQLEAAFTESKSNAFLA